MYSAVADQLTDILIYIYLILNKFGKNPPAEIIKYLKICLYSLVYTCVLSCSECVKNSKLMAAGYSTRHIP